MTKQDNLLKFLKKYYYVLFISVITFVYLIFSSSFEIIKFSAISLCFFVFIFCLINQKSNLWHFIFQLGILIFSLLFIYRNLNVTIFSVVFIFIILKYLISDSLINFNLLKFNSFKNVFSGFILLFIITVLLQSLYLDIETIDWDVHSYLVTSLEIGRGNLPYENQWEDKQPAFFYFYYFFISLSNGSIVAFRLLNDFLLFLCALIVYFISKQTSNKTHHSLISPLIFICLMSIPWGTAEYSELYSVLFLGLAFYLLLVRTKAKYLIFTSGLLFSISTLINIGTLLFAAAYFIQIYNFSKKDLFKNLTLFGLGFISLHIFFLYLYFSNGLLDIYIATLISIPFGYGGNISINVSSFNSFLKSFFEFNIFLYLILLTSLLQKGFNISKELFENKKINIENNINNIYLFLSIVFFLIAAKGFNHHLIFFLFFLSINPMAKSFVKVKPIFLLLIFSFFMFQLFSNSQNTELAFEEDISKPGYQSILSNLSNLGDLEDDYPLKKLSKEIDSYFVEDYTVLALDSNLILFYLDKPNYSYIIHPTNHFEPWITSNLLKTKRIQENNIIKMIDTKPDVIICSNNSIAKDSPNYEYFNCAVSDYYSEYIKLDTTKYERNILIEYYFDRYKNISVFVKINE